MSEKSLAVHLLEKFETDRQKIEQYAALADHCPLPAFIVDQDCESILYVNPAYEELTGHTLDDLHDGKWIDLVIHRDDRDSVAAAWQLFKATGRAAPHWHRYIHPDGTVTDALTTLERVRGNGYVGFILPQCGSSQCPIVRLNRKALGGAMRDWRLRQESHLHASV